MFVLFIGPLILIVNIFDFKGDLLNLVESSIIHPLFESVFSDEFFNMKTSLLKIDLENVNFFPEVKDGVLVNITFDPKINQHFTFVPSQLYPYLVEEDHISSQVQR